MSLTKIVLVARKTLTELLREPVLLLFTLLLPAFFMVITYVGYGSSPKTATYRVWVIQETAAAEPMIEKLRLAHYPDGRPAYALTIDNDRNAAEAALNNQSAVILLTFSADASGQVHLTTRGDALNMAYTKAGTQIDALLQPMFEAAQGKPQLIAFDEKTLALARPLSDFEAYTPGMMIFAILLLVPQTAMLVGREMRWGTLRRLQLTRLSPAEYLGGISLAQVLVAGVQVLVMLGSALLFGFHNRGSLGLTLALGMLLALGSIGLGLVVACFIRNDTDALNTGSVVSMLIVFFSGAFFAMPMPALFTLAGHQINAFDIFPQTHGMLALQQVLTGGAGLETVAFRATAAALLSVLYFTLGVFFFSLRQRAGHN